MLFLWVCFFVCFYRLFFSFGLTAKWSGKYGEFPVPLSPQRPQPLLLSVHFWLCSSSSQRTSTDPSASPHVHSLRLGSFLAAFVLSFDVQCNDMFTIIISYNGFHCPPISHPLPHKPLATTDLFTVSMVLPFPESHIVGIPH